LPQGCASICSTINQLESELQAELQKCNPAPPPPPKASVTLAAIEVTQVIQDLNQSVPLIAGKQTWARVYLSPNAALGAVTVTGTLQIQDSSFKFTTVQSNAPVALTPGTTLKQKRDSWAASLNFLIPANLTSSNSAYTLTLATVSAQGAGNVPCINCAATTQSVTYVNAPPMRLRIVPIQYTDPNNNIITPVTANFTLLTSWLGRAYPINQLISSVAAPVPTTIPLATLFNTASGCGGGTCGCGATNTLLSVIRVIEVFGLGFGPGPIDPRTHYYGMVLTDPNAPNGGFLRGCTPIGGYVSSGPVGLTGQANGDWYGGHELGHSYGRLHPAAAGATTTGFCGAGPGLDTSYPYPNGEISDSQDDFIGLDVGDPTIGAPVAARDGVTDFDVMTYCPPYWISDYTYKAILNGPSGLVAQDPSGNGPGGSTSPPQFTSGSFVSVVATINMTKKSGKIEFAQTVGRAYPVRFATPNKASLRFLDATGKSIAEYAVNVNAQSDVDAAGDTIGSIEATVPYPSNAAKLDLYFAETLIDERTISKTKPAVRNLKTTGPGVLVWETTPAAGPSLTYFAQASADGKNWDVIAVNLDKPELRLSAQQLRQYRQVRIVANDGFNNSAPAVIKLPAP